MSESTCRALCYSDADCLSSVRNYLQGTVLQWCRLFKQCQKLPAGHCVTAVQTVLAVSEPTCRARCYRLFKRCQNLPAGHCVKGVQTVQAVSEPTYRALCYSGADCLCGVDTYLPGTVLYWCRLIKHSQNLPAGHCVAGVQTV